MLAKTRLKLLLLGAMGAPLAAHAVPLYNVNMLGTVSGHSANQPTALNNNGEVAGHSLAPAGYNGFLYSGGTMTGLGTLGGTSSYAFGINDAGQVSGYSTTGAGLMRAFVYSGGSMTTLGTLGGSESYGADINNFGVVSGTAALANNAIFHAAIFSGGNVTDLGTLGGTGSAGNGINDAGMVTGNAFRADGFYHAFRYVGGVMTDLGTLGGTASDGIAINAAGAVVGNSWIAGNNFSHAFLTSGGVMLDLGTLGGTDSYAYGINDAGTVVGASKISNDVQHAYVYTGGIMVDLNSLIDPTLGLTLTYAAAINNSGQIAAEGCRSDGSCQSVLLSLAATPPDPDPRDVPEPASFTAVAAALGLAGFVRRRKQRARQG